MQLYAYYLKEHLVTFVASFSNCYCYSACGLSSCACRCTVIVCKLVFSILVTSWLIVPCWRLFWKNVIVIWM